jgi:nitrogen regulatory protein PII-like uncharacterized protein
MTASLAAVFVKTIDDVSKVAVVLVTVVEEWSLSNGY